MRKAEILVFALLIILLSNGYAIIDAFFYPDIPYFSAPHILFGTLIILIGVVFGMILWAYKKELYSVTKDYAQLKSDLINEKKASQKVDTSRLPNLQALSHEVRTAMSGILTFSELLLEQNLNRDQQKMSADMIHSSGERMLYVINELMDLLRIESGVEREHLSQVNINELIDILHNQYGSEVKRKGLSFDLDKPLSDEMSVIDSDRVKIISILSHFVSNAIKFTKRGSVTMGYEIVPLDEGVYSDYVLRFFVKDTGIGVTSEKKRGLFKGILPTDLNTEDANVGIGLGLFISKVYAEILGGKVGVESDGQTGSMFWFQIPYDGKVDPKELLKNDLKEAEDKNDKQTNFKILIVEDDELSEKYLKEILKNTGNQLFYAHSGAVAVEMCRNMPNLDLVLMDIKMPMMNGYEATNKIREFNQEIVIFAQTAYAQPKDRTKALKSGFNEYLTKPVNKKKLMELMDKHLRKEFHFSENDL